MRTLGPGSLASILKIFLDVTYFLLLGLIGLASLIFVLIVVAGLYRLIGPLPLALEEFLAMDVVIALPMAIIGTATLIFIIHRLRLIFRTLIEGDPFVPENANHLRALAVAIGVFQILSYASHGVIALLFSILGKTVSASWSVMPGLSLNFGAWFAVLAFLVLAEIFREGARLRDEQKFTI